MLDHIVWVTVSVFWIMRNMVICVMCSCSVYRIMFVCLIVCIQRVIIRACVSFLVIRLMLYSGCALLGVFPLSKASSLAEPPS